MTTEKASEVAAALVVDSHKVRGERLIMIILKDRKQADNLLLSSLLIHINILDSVAQLA